MQKCVKTVKRLLVVSPQTVVEGLHSVLGYAVRTTDGADSAEHTGDVHHSASALLDEREDAQCHADDATQVDGQHGLVVLYGEPVGRGRRKRDAGIVYDGPQTWSATDEKP